jgi:hypothetical protein
MKNRKSKYSFVTLIISLFCCISCNDVSNKITPRGNFPCLEFFLPNGDHFTIDSDINSISKSKKLEYIYYNGLTYRTEDSILGSYNVVIGNFDIADKFYDENKSLEIVFKEVKNIKVNNYKLLLNKFMEDSLVEKRLKENYKEKHKIDIIFGDPIKVKNPYKGWIKEFFQIINCKKWVIGSIVSNETKETNEINILNPQICPQIHK